MFQLRYFAQGARAALRAIRMRAGQHDEFENAPPPVAEGDTLPLASEWEGVSSVNCADRTKGAETDLSPLPRLWVLGCCPSKVVGILHRALVLIFRADPRIASEHILL